MCRTVRSAECLSAPSDGYRPQCLSRGPSSPTCFADLGLFGSGACMVTTSLSVRGGLTVASQAIASGTESSPASPASAVVLFGLKRKPRETDDWCGPSFSTVSWFCVFVRYQVKKETSNLAGGGPVAPWHRHPAHRPAVVDLAWQVHLTFLQTARNTAASLCCAAALRCVCRKIIRRRLNSRQEQSGLDVQYGKHCFSSAHVTYDEGTTCNHSLCCVYSLSLFPSFLVPLFLRSCFVSASFFRTVTD